MKERGTGRRGSPRISCSRTSSWCCRSQVPGSAYQAAAGAAARRPPPTRCFPGCRGARRSRPPAHWQCRTRPRSPWQPRAWSWLRLCHPETLWASTCARWVARVLVAHAGGALGCSSGGAQQAQRTPSAAPCLTLSAWHIVQPDAAVPHHPHPAPGAGRHRAELGGHLRRPRRQDLCPRALRHRLCGRCALSAPLPREPAGQDRTQLACVARAWLPRWCSSFGGAAGGRGSSPQRCVRCAAPLAVAVLLHSSACSLDAPLLPSKQVGSVVIIAAMVNRTFRSSMEVRAGASQEGGTSTFFLAVGAASLRPLAHMHGGAPTAHPRCRQQCLAGGRGACRG